MRQRGSIGSMLLVAGGLAMTACSSADLVLPGDGAPANLVAVAGDGQTGEAGRPLADSLVVLVTDHNRDPVAAAAVRWTVSGGGSVSAATTMTDSTGRAGVIRTLGPVPGSQGTVATVQGSEDPPVTFKATALLTTIRLKLTGVLPDSVRTGQELTPHPVVQLTDPDGAAVLRPGVAVTVAIASGGGTLDGTTTRTTGPDGSAEFDDLVLRGPAGPRTLIFAADSTAGLTVGPVVLTAGPVSGSRSTLSASAGTVTASDGGNTTTVTLTALDATGSPVSGADVKFSGPNQLVFHDADQTTGADGTAQVKVSSRQAGSWDVAASAAGVTLGQHAAITVLAGPAAVNHSTAQVPNGRAGEATTVSIQLEDAFGNPVTSGAQVAVSVSGANSATAQGAPAAGGYQAAYTPTVAGVDQVRVEVGGHELTASPYSSTVAPGPADAGHAVADIPALVVYRSTRVTVTAQDRFGNPIGSGGNTVAVQVTGGGVAVTDQGNGTYTADFVVFWPGNYQIVVTFDGAQVPGSPFTRQAHF